MLFNTLIAVALAVIDTLTGTSDEDMGLGLLSGLYAARRVAIGSGRIHGEGRGPGCPRRLDVVVPSAS